MLEVHGASAGYEDVLVCKTELPSFTRLNTLCTPCRTPMPDAFASRRAYVGFFWIVGAEVRYGDVGEQCVWWRTGSIGRRFDLGMAMHLRDLVRYCTHVLLTAA